MGLFGVASQQDVDQLDNRLAKIEHAHGPRKLEEISRELSTLRAQVTDLQREVTRLREAASSPIVSVMSTTRPTVTISFEDLLAQVKEALEPYLLARREDAEQLVRDYLDQMDDDGKLERLADRVYANVDVSDVLDKVAPLLAEQLFKDTDSSDVVNTIAEQYWKDVSTEDLTEQVAVHLTDRLQLRPVTPTED